MTISHVYHPIPGVDGGSYDANPSPPVLALHTTEGRSIAGAEAAYRHAQVAPHYTIDLSLRVVAKHLPTHRSASALRNLPGGVQTNRRGRRVVQVEIVGFAADSPNRSQRELLFLGRFIRQLCAENDIPLICAEFHDRPDVERFTPDHWLTFTGICGHQHVPENDHWDPGALDVARALQLSAPDPIPPTPPSISPSYEVPVLIIRRDTPTHSLLILGDIDPTTKKPVAYKGHNGAVEATTSTPSVKVDEIVWKSIADRHHIVG